MKHLPQRLAYLLAGVGAVTLIALALRPAAVRVDVGEVKRQSVQVTVDGEGKTRIRSRFVVSAPVAGRLARIDLKAGNQVQRGEVVAQIAPLPLTAQVQEAQARLRQWQAERAGVETQRPKAAALSQAQARIRAAEAAQQEAEARQQQEKATLEQFKRERQRARQLQAEGAISQQDLEQAQLAEVSQEQQWQAAQREVARAAAEVTAARKALALLQAEQKDPDYLLRVYDARLAQVRAELSRLADEAARTTVRSPLDGSVLRVLQESARYVEAGTPLLELGNPAELEVVVDLLSSDAVKVKPGAKMLVEGWGGNTPLVAKVRYVEPSAFTKVSALGVEEQRVNVIADFLTHPVPLGDGYRVETRTVIWEGKEVLVVPLSALFRCDTSQDAPDTWCTFVVAGDRARQRQVKVSQRSSFEAVVERGLASGEKVILHPTEQIQEGTRVRFKH